MWRRSLGAERRRGVTPGARGSHRPCEGPDDDWGQVKQALVELALRQQLAVLRQAGRRPTLTSLDRGFWVLLRQLWSRWREVLVVVQPETVVRWHRKGFRLYWRFRSGRRPGQPRIPKEVRLLVRRMALENPWGARKVHAELAKLSTMIADG